MPGSSDRDRFDRLLDRVIEELPPSLHELLEQVPLIVEDEPSDRLLAELGIDRRQTELCGLHWGTPLTQRSVEHGATLPDQMMIFRGPIMRMVQRSRGGPDQASRELARQIRITVLHEIGHHFGLSEADLEALGYG